MSENLEEEPFKEAKDRVEAAYEQAVADLKSKVEKAKSAALKKIS